MACTHDTLQSYTRDSEAWGQSNTKTAQKRFAQQLRGVLGRINAAIRRGIIEDDVFELQDSNTDTLAVDDPGPFETESNPQKVTQFIAWLREQLETNYLTVVGPDRNQWVRMAYVEGIRHTHRELSELDVSFSDPDSILPNAVHQRALQQLYNRTYENLQQISSDLVDDVRLTLLEGFREGRNPSDIARTLTDRVDSIGKYRSTLIARSEVMNAHSTSTLNRIDEVNETTDAEIAVSHGEWSTAKDARVCAFCRALDGTAFNTQEMRETTVEVTASLTDDGNFAGNTFRLKPPAHPQGRCRILPQIGADITGSLNDRLPEQINAQ
jgi:uncharacterized protein with gpF-like domain